MSKEFAVCRLELFCQGWVRGCSFLQSRVELAACHHAESQSLHVWVCHMQFHECLQAVWALYQVFPEIHHWLSLVWMVDSATWICPKGCWTSWVDCLPSLRLHASSLRSHPSEVLYLDLANSGKMSSIVLEYHWFLSITLLKSFGSRHSLRLPLGFITGTIELIHSVCSLTLVIMPFFISLFSSAL